MLCLIITRDEYRAYIYIMLLSHVRDEYRAAQFIYFDIFRGLEEFDHI